MVTAITLDAMSTAIYPFGADHDDRDLVRVRAELGARHGSTTLGRRLGFRRRADRTRGRTTPR
jgi:hypothetical protein